MHPESGAADREPPFGRNNHYTPRVYLRGFSRPGRKILVYRTLVSHVKSRLWSECSTRGVGYLTHLYTRIAAGQETDEIERWLSRDFENPAAESLDRVTSGERLRQADWYHLVRFLAAQIVRTPAYFLKSLPRWKASVPKILDSALQDAVRELKSPRKSGQSIVPEESHHSQDFPLRVTTRKEPEREMAELGVSVVVGRSLWLANIRHLLSAPGATKVLHDHKWTIVAPYEALEWFTSDDPVVLLNYYGAGKYDFGGGCGIRGTEIFLPLSPRHLLYTHVGEQPRRRGDVLTRDLTQMIRRFIAEHAHRMILAASPDEGASSFRPRVVDGEKCRAEQRQWKNWHQDQAAAELRLSRDAFQGHR